MLNKQYNKLFLKNKTADEYQEVQPQLNEFKRGFDRRINIDYMGVPTYGDAKSRTFTLTPKSGYSYFEFWAKGKYFKKTTAQTLACPDTTGTYYWYFDTNGVLQVALDGTIGGTTFVLSAICGMAYYNKEAGTFEGAIDEQHGTVLGGENHLYLHLTQKFKYANGGEIIGLVDGADSYTKITKGVHFDEDIPNVSPESTVHSFMYRWGAGEDTAGWEFSTADSKIGFKNGESYVVFNKYNSGTGNWELPVSTSSTDYIIYMFAKTNLITHRYVKVVGQQAFPNRSAARTALKNELKAVNLQGLPSAEFEWQWAYICKRNGELEDDGNSNGYIDLRGININSLDN